MLKYVLPIVSVKIRYPPFEAVGKFVPLIVTGSRTVVDPGTFCVTEDMAGAGVTVTVRLPEHVAEAALPVSETHTR